MNEATLVESLQKLTGDALLGQFAADALALIRGTQKITVDDHGDNATTDRRSLLGIYELRQKRLTNTQTTVPGFEATGIFKGQADKVKP